MGTYTVKYISLNTHLGANFCSKQNLPLMLCVRRGTTDIKEAKSHFGIFLYNPSQLQKNHLKL